jgi:hypothetical protein
MDNWDQEAIDLVQPGFIEFGEDGLGSLGFIVVTGDLDCRDADRDGQPGALNLDGTLVGHIYFHLGDESGFRAERFNEASGERPRRSRDGGSASLPPNVAMLAGMTREELEAAGGVEEDD